MHSVIAHSLARLPECTKTPRTWSYDIPEHFVVDHPIFNVRIRIDTPSYRTNGHPGWQSTCASDTFETEMVQLLAVAGMAKDGNYFFPEDGTGDEHVYTHPDDLSGMMTIDRALALIDALKSGDFRSTLQWVDVYEVHERLSEDEALKRFEYCKGTIREEILTLCQTKRKTMFKYFTPLNALNSIPGFSFVERKDFTSLSPIPTALTEALVELRDQLVKEGWLNIHLSQDGRTAFRTSNKTEQRARGLLNKPKASVTVPRVQGALL